MGNQPSSSVDSTSTPGDRRTSGTTGSGTGASNVSAPSRNQQHPTERNESQNPSGHTSQRLPSTGEAQGAKMFSNALAKMKATGPALWEKMRRRNSESGSGMDGGEDACETPKRSVSDMMGLQRRHHHPADESQTSKQEEEMKKTTSTRQSKLLGEELSSKIKQVNNSNFLTDYQLALVLVKVPRQYRYYKLLRLFSLKEDGANVQILLRKVKKHPVTITFIKDTKGAIFGGFSTSPWCAARNYYGGFQTFVFSLSSSSSAGNHEDPEKQSHVENGQKDSIARTVSVISVSLDADIKVYKWTGGHSYFQFCPGTAIAMGGGGGFAWYLDEDLHHGSSVRSQTFDNPCLASSNDYRCVDMEVWGLMEPNFGGGKSDH